MKKSHEDVGLKKLTTKLKFPRVFNYDQPF